MQEMKANSTANLGRMAAKLHPARRSETPSRNGSFRDAVASTYRMPLPKALMTCHLRQMQTAILKRIFAK